MTDQYHPQAALQHWLQENAPGYLWVVTPHTMEDVPLFLVQGWMRNPATRRDGEPVVISTPGVGSERLERWIETVPNHFR